MNNLRVSLTRFLKNKNTVTILAILLCLIILYWAYNYRINKKTNPINVPYALREIEPRTLITSELVGTIKVPGSMVSSGVVKNTTSVIGKYVKEDAVIPSGSLFFSKVLVAWEDLPRSMYAEIPEGNTVVSLPVSLETTYGNSIYPGNYIDLYFATQTADGKLLLGKLIESIRVLSVTDIDGKNIFEKSVDLNPPAYLIFSVSEEYHLLLRKASYLAGTIFPVPRNADYSLNPTDTKISSSYIQNYILSQTVNVAEEDLKRLDTTDITTNNDLNDEISNTGNNEISNTGNNEISSIQNNDISTTGGN